MESCKHVNWRREPADRAVGIMYESVICEDCDADLTDDPEHEPDYEGMLADTYEDEPRDWEP